MTLTAVAAVFGVSTDTMRARCLELGIRKPRRRNKDRLHVRLQEKFTTEQLKALSQYDIAKIMDCAQPYVNKALKQLGIKSNYHEHCKEKTQQEIEQVIDCIQNNGGRVKSTIRKLGLKLDRGKVYRYCKEHNIDLSIYIFAHRRYGDWLTLPGHAEKCQKSDYKLDAMCQCCCEIYKVQLVNLVHGSTTRCCSCSKRNLGGNIQVRCEEKGQIFRSISSWSDGIEGHGNYKTLRLKIAKTGSCCIDCKTYSLIEK
jgi:hypothetical protein